MGLSPLHWIDTSWWCSCHNVVIPLSSVFVFFLSHAIAAVATQLCLPLLLHPLCLSLSFMEDDIGLLGSPHFCRFLGLWACLPYFLPGWPIGPYFFLFFLWGFYNPLFLPLLVNHFSQSFLLVTGLFCYWALFCQKWVSTTNVNSGLNT